MNLGENIGAKWREDKAESDKRIPSEAEKRRHGCRHGTGKYGQSKRHGSQINRAQASIPMAIAEIFQSRPLRHHGLHPL